MEVTEAVSSLTYGNMNITLDRYVRHPFYTALHSFRLVSVFQMKAILEQTHQQLTRRDCHTAIGATYIIRKPNTLRLDFFDSQVRLT